MQLDLVHLLLEGMGRVDALAPPQTEPLPQGGGQPRYAACHIQEELGNAVIRLREFPVTAGVGLVMHVAAQGDHKAAAALPQPVDPSADVRPLPVAVLLHQVEVPLL